MPFGRSRSLAQQIFGLTSYDHFIERISLLSRENERKGKWHQRERQQLEFHVPTYRAQGGFMSMQIEKIRIPCWTPCPNAIKRFAAR
jgi:hypothetical protein